MDKFNELEARISAIETRIAQNDAEKIKELERVKAAVRLAAEKGMEYILSKKS